MKYHIAVIKGDGIGPEVIDEAVKVLQAVGTRYGHSFQYTYLKAGGDAIDACGQCLPEETVQKAKESDAVLLGAVGGPKWDSLPGAERPERALLGLRKALGLFANLRPAIMFDALKDACPLKPEKVAGGLDLLVVRELTGGIYFGERGTKETADMGLAAYDVEQYAEKEVERIAEISRLWRKTVARVAEKYPQVTLENFYVDNAAMQLVYDPKQFDVLVTSNIFGDILSDEASMITGSIGMLPSASLAEGAFGMYEPVHGSAPDIAGTGKANPIAAILSAGMLLRYTLGLTTEADAIEQAVKDVLKEGWRTADIAQADSKAASTAEMGSLIAEKIR